MSEILLIDDSVELLRTMQRLLEDRGHTVHTATNGQWDHLIDFFFLCPNIDTVVCDWDLGPFSPHGGKVTTNLRERYPNVRIIIYSALERKVPDGVEFHLKDDLVGLLDALEET